MANPLDPTKPTLLDPSIELVEELRAIKGRLVTDRDNIQQLQNTLVDITGITSFGAQLLASTGADAALDILDFTATGKEISQVASYAALATALGVQSPVPTITVGVGHWCVQFAGGFKINVITITTSDDGTTAPTWLVPFTTSIWGAVATLFTPTTQGTTSCNVNNATLTGCTLDHGGSGNRLITVIAVGI